MRVRIASKGVLVDLTRCIGCRGCQVACKEWNGRSTKKTVMSGNFTNPPDLNSETYSIVRFIEREENNLLTWDFIKIQCMHCKDPACASVCPVGAIKKTGEGPVIYYGERCIGCRYCMLACPFKVPKYEWEKTFPLVQKCTFCHDRIADGRAPACANACPTNTILYGNHDEVLAEAKRRLRENPGKYVNHIYGEKEAGGTSWIYLSGVPFEEIGFNTRIPNVGLPNLTWASISKIPYAVSGLIAILSLIVYFRNRGEKEEGSAKSEGDKEMPQ